MPLQLDLVALQRLHHNAGQILNLKTIERNLRTRRGLQRNRYWAFIVCKVGAVIQCVYADDLSIVASKGLVLPSEFPFSARIRDD
jgi:hypothetical protein